MKKITNKLLFANFYAIKIQKKFSITKKLGHDYYHKSENKQFS